jgi:RimJ/RimL family protein N-acetyltransferase
MDCPPIVTGRLTLRRPDVDDIDAIVRIVGDLEVARRLSRIPHPYRAADARFFLEQIVPTEWVWAITLTGADTLIGVVGLTPSEANDRAELGYWLAPDHWGRGIATDAAKAVLTFGFDHLNLTLITSGYFQDNAASGRVLEKLGFRIVGRDVRPCKATGIDVGSVVMERSRSSSVGAA